MNLKKITFLIKGANLDKFLNDAVLLGIDFKKILRVDSTTLKVRINKKDCNSLIAILNKKCYDFSISENTKYFEHRMIAVLAGFAVCIALFLTANCFCWGIKVNSDDKELVDKISTALAQNGFNGGFRWKDFDSNVAEQVIRDNISDLGLVNVTRRGAVLWVNVSKVIPQPDLPINASSGVYATANGVVSRIFVSSGTALVRVGDTVSLGQLLIAPYFINAQEEEVPIAAKGTVYLEIWESGTVQFDENGYELLRTGNFVYSEEMLFLNKTIYKKDTEINFDKYERVEKFVNVGGVIPIKMKYTYYYEQESVPTTKKFSDVEQSLIYEAKQIVLTKVNETEITRERHTVSVIDGIYYVTYYVAREIKI